MKRIVMFEGGVETLGWFSHQMAERFREAGYLVFFYNLEDEDTSAKKLRKFIKTGETALVTFNFQGLEKEAGVYSEREGYVWDAYRIPCYNIAADHPYFYHDRLRELPKAYYHVSIDRFHQKYFREFYPEFSEAGFLPLAGTELADAADGRKLQTASRPIDVVFTGNYTELPFFEPYINWINDEYAEFYRGIIQELIQKPAETVEAVALRHCEREMGKVACDQLRGAFYRMIFIDLYVRNYWRGLAVRLLADAGIRVDVVGKGWEDLDCEHPENLILHPQTDSVTCLRLLRQSKISLNVMPWFKDGAHDRVFNSILNGAVCVSDTSAYLGGELADGEGVCYFDLGKIQELPVIVQELLQDREKMESISAKGMPKVRAYHTWAQRADTLAEGIQRGR